MRDPMPPAPPSDATVSSAPEFIVDGAWDDKEWRDVAAKPSHLWTPAEKYLWAGGPRPHPWGRASYSAARPDGTKVTFPSKDAHDQHMKHAATVQQDGEGQAQSALNSLNAGLAAHAVKPASDPGQADAMLEAASPNGTVAS